MREALWEAILRSTRDAIISIDRRGRITLFNPAAEEMFGYSADEVLGCEVGILMPPPFRDEHQEYIRRYEQGGPPRAIGRIRQVVGRRRDGSEFPIELSVSEARVGDEVVYSAVIRDVTERLAVEEELRRQRDLAQGILDAAQAIVLLLDTDGRIVEYNAYFEELSGYRLEEVRGRDWFQTFLPEADRPRIRRLFFQVLGEGLIRGNVNPIVTRAGDLRLIEWHARTLHDIKGRPVGIVSVGHDITERETRSRQQAVVAELGPYALAERNVGAVLQTACERVAGALDAESVHVVEPLPGNGSLHVTAGWGRLLEVAAAARAQGKAESLVRAAFERGEPALLRDTGSEGAEDFSELEAAGVRSILVVPMGAPHRLGVLEAWSSVPGRFQDADFHFVFSVAHLLAEAIMLRRTERRLAAQYAVTKALADAGTLEEAVAGVLGAMCRELGYEVGEFWESLEDGRLGLRFAWTKEPAAWGEFVRAGRELRLGPGDGLPGRVLEKRRPLWEFDVTQASGTFRRTEAARHAGLHGAFAFPVTGTGELRAVLAFFRSSDFTPDPDLVLLAESLGRQIGEFLQRKEAEARLREAERVARQRQRLADVGAITTRLVHDLGNPIAGLSMQAQLLVRRLQRGEIDQLEQPAGRILTAVGRVDTLIRELKEVAREQTLCIEAVDPAVFIKDVVDAWSHPAEERGVRIHVRLPEGPLPPLPCDAEKLHRVLDNLIANAIDALQPAGGEITIEVAFPENDKIRISVTDSGCGIPDHIDPFRLFETTKPDGTGLGLPIARQIVDAHGGQIWHERTPGSGTTFHVQLPLDRPAVPGAWSRPS